jgi:hypothetical protein
MEASMAVDDVDLNIMSDFHIGLYGRNHDPTLTARERLQLGIAHIIKTSVEDARYSIKHADKEALKHALALAGDRKTLKKAIEAELRRREKLEKAAIEQARKMNKFYEE